MRFNIKNKIANPNFVLENIFSNCEASEPFEESQANSREMNIICN